MLPNNSIINKLLYLLVVQLIPICATAQSSGMNYIQTKTFLDEDGLTFLTRNLSLRHLAQKLEMLLITKI